MSDLRFKKYGGILQQIHKLNKYIRYFVLCLCKKFPPSFWEMWGIPGKHGGKGQSPALDQTLVTGENAAFSPVTRV